MSNTQTKGFENLARDIIQDITCKTAGMVAELDCMYYNNQDKAKNTNKLIILALSSYLDTINNELLKISPEHALSLERKMIENVKGGGKNALVPFSKSELSLSGKKGTSLTLALLKMNAEKAMNENRLGDFMELSMQIQKIEESQTQLSAFVIRNPCAWSTFVGLPVGSVIGWCVFQFVKAPLTISTGAGNAGVQAVSNSFSNMYSWVRGTTNTTPTLESAAKVGAESANALVNAMIPQQLKIAYLVIAAILAFSLLFIYISRENEKTAVKRRNFLKNTGNATRNAVRLIKNTGNNAVNNAVTRRRKNLATLGLSEGATNANIKSARVAIGQKARMPNATNANRAREVNASNAFDRLKTN